jgi:cytochrome P450
VLSRYADVLAALREPRLCQVGPRSKHGSGICDKSAQLLNRSEVRAALPPSRLAEWQWQIKLLADTMIDQLPKGRSIDLVREFVRPWSLGVTLIINEVDSVHIQRLTDLAHDLPGGETDCYNAVLRSRTAAAIAELRSTLEKRVGVTPICKSAFRVFSQSLYSSIASASFALPKRAANTEFEELHRKGAIRLGRSVFLGTSQTIPFFLANAWLALLRHPTELDRLRAEPDLMPRAIEELLRYTGTVHTLFRQATEKVDLCGIRILAGERVILKLGSANRDPAQFPEPDHLDLGHRGTGQVALGAGPNSCVGALLVRMTAAVATSAFLEKFGDGEMSGAVEWYRNDTVCSPASLRVLLRRRPTHGPMRADECPSMAMKALDQGRRTSLSADASGTHAKKSQQGIRAASQFRPDLFSCFSRHGVSGRDDAEASHWGTSARDQ